MLSDSTLISGKLVVDGLAEDLNSKLTAAEKAQDMAIRALLEDKLYFYQVRDRYRLCFVRRSQYLSTMSKENIKANCMWPAYLRISNAGSRTTTPCVPKYSALFLTLCRSLLDNWHTAK